MFWGLWQKFWPKSLYPDLTGVTILACSIFLVDFFGWVFQLLKIKYPSNSSETFKILFFHQNNQFEGKTACFADFSILTKIAVSGPYRRGHFVGCFFFVEYFTCWKYPSNSSETFKILFFHQNNRFEAKTACFADFSIVTKIAVSGPYRRGHFVGWFFWLSFPNVENTLRILLKHSKFCSFIKTISLRQKQHVFRTFQFWPKSLYPDLTSMAIFLVELFNCWKYPSNSSEIFKILFFHQNNQFEAKTACFADFSILTKIAVSGPYRRGHFVVDFFGWVFQLLKMTILFCWLIFLDDYFEFFWNIQNFVRSSKQSVWSKNSMFCGLFNFDQNRCIRTIPAWPFCCCCWFFFFWNIQNFVYSSKQCWKYPSLILLKHSKFCSFMKTISLKEKQHVLRTFQFWPKSLYPDLTGVAILLVDFFGWFFEMLKIPFQFFWNIQNFVLLSKQSVWSKNSMFCGLFNFDQNRCIRTLPAWPFCWLIFWNVENTLPILLKHSWNMLFIKKISLKQKQHVLRTFQFWPKSLYPDLTGVAILFCWLIFLDDYFKCWKYPSYSSETFKILFFHENNQFKGKTACFADFSILTKIAVSGPYRRGHFVGWFFWLIFWNVENTLPILLKHSKFCSFIKTISLKQKQHVLRTFQFWPKSLYPDLTGVAYFFGWFFEMLKIPFQFFWNIQNFVLWWKQSVWRKNSMFCGLFNFDQNRCIRTLPTWPFCWLIFLVDFLKCWKYPSNSSETFKMLFFYQNNQFEAKAACFADFSILTKIAVSGPYRRGHFVSWFFEMLKIPFQFFWNIHETCYSSKKSVWSKNSMFCGLFNFHLNRCIRTLPAWPFIFVGCFFRWVFQMLKIPFEFFWNIQNVVLLSKQSVWSKSSMFCGLFNFDQNRCIRTLPAWPFCWLIFLVEFSKCWKYPSYSSETFKILFFHQNNQFEAKTACFPDFSILTKIALSGPYRRGHFFGWFFQMLKIPFQFFWNIQDFVLSSKQSIWTKNSMFCGLFNFDENRCIRTLPSWPFCWSTFLVEFFKCWKYPSNSSETFKMLFFHQNNQFEAKTAIFSDFSILTKIAVSGPYRCDHFVIYLVDFLKCWKYPSNSSETFKILFFHQNTQVEAKTACFADFSILTKITVSGPYRHVPFCWFDFFGWVFQMLKITLPILLKHSKFCSFIKTSSLRQKQHVFRTFQFWPKSLYPDLTGMAILLVHFFGWFFQMLKIPFQFFWNIQNVVLSSKQSVWSKNSMFCGLFNFYQNRCIRTLPGWQFCLLIFLVELFKCWKYPSNSSEKFKILFFHQNNQFEAKTAFFSDFSILTKIAVSGHYRHGHLVGWFFWLSFPNVENTLPILLKHSKFYSFIKTSCLRQKQHVFRTFQFWPKSLYPDLTSVAIFLLSFSIVENTLRILLKHSKFCSFIKTISLKQKQHVLRTFQFWPKSLYPDHTGVAILLVVSFLLSISHVENTLRILLKHSKFCSFIKTIGLKQKQHVLRTFQLWPKSLYPDLTGVAILLVDFLVEFSKCWKFPSNPSETFKILFFHQNNQFEAKTPCFPDFSILTKIALSGPYQHGHFFGRAFQLLKIPFEIFWNIQNFVVSSKQSVWRKNSMFCGLFNLDQNRCIRTLPAWPFSLLIFLVEFFNCWKYRSNSSETFKILFVHQNNQFEAKTACFADFSILTKIAVSGPYRRGHFVSWFFEMLKIPFQFFWNIQNFVLSWKQSVWRKNSMFCGLFNFDQNRCIRTLPAWPFC